MTAQILTLQLALELRRRQLSMGVARGRVAPAR